MIVPQPNNNEFSAAEVALRKIGSNLWFSGLPEQWQNFLTSNTVELFDTYEITIEQAANRMIEVYQQLVSSNPEVLALDPWSLVQPS